jgi:hypothetical protein
MWSFFSTARGERSQVQGRRHGERRRTRAPLFRSRNTPPSTIPGSRSRIRRPVCRDWSRRGPCARDLRPHRYRPRTFKAPANEAVRGGLDLEYWIDEKIEDSFTSKGYQPQLLRPRHPALGRANLELQLAMEIRVHAPSLHLSPSVDLRGNPVGGVRAE